MPRARARGIAARTEDHFIGCFRNEHDRFHVGRRAGRSARHSDIHNETRIKCFVGSKRRAPAGITQYSRAVHDRIN